MINYLLTHLLMIMIDYLLTLLPINHDKLPLNTLINELN